jgi:hypothetical protein
MDKTRYPRARFTRSLAKICTELERAPIRDVAHKDFLDRPAQTRTQIRALWVVGSYARGALECGDLDLVLDAVGLDRGLPRIKKVARSFFGATPRVAFYGGTPEDNSSGVVFPEAKLIWSSEQPNWRSAIASIAEDAQADHFERPSDHLPLTPEQMRGNINDIEELLRDRNAGRIQWSHIDFCGGHRSEPQVPEQFAETFSRYHDLGKATRHALAHFLVASAGRPWANGDLVRRERTTFCLGGTEIHVGTPRLPSKPLEIASKSRLALVPHLTARGPNRAWIIERGIAHPLAQQAEDRVAYVLAHAGCPIETLTQDSEWSWMSMLELFTSRAVAEAFAKDMDMDEFYNEVAQEEGEPAQVIELSGQLLLESIAQVDRLEIMNETSERYEVFIMKEFEYYDADPQALFDKLMALLPMRERQKRG